MFTKALLNVSYILSDTASESALARHFSAEACDNRVDPVSRTRFDPAVSWFDCGEFKNRCFSMTLLQYLPPAIETAAVLTGSATGCVRLGWWPFF